MKWKDITVGTVVYHKIFTHWGKGIVQQIVPFSCLFEKGTKRAWVVFEHEEGRALMAAPMLRKTPNKKRIKEMIEYYKINGFEAKDGGDRLILPE